MNSRINDILLKKYRDGLGTGLSEGYRIAKLILLRFADNHKLREPKSLKTLIKWTEEDLEILHDRIRENARERERLQ